MQHTLQQPNVEAGERSAFKPVEQGKSPTPCLLTSEHCDKRDSGYGTDNSPATLIITTRRFTFDKDEISDNIPGTSGDMGEVFPKDFENMTLEENTSEEVSDSSVFSYETDDDNLSMEDKEVQELFQSNCNTVPIQPASGNVRRPSAPIPSPEEDYVSHTSHNANFIPIGSITRPGLGGRYNPTVSRGTQTPSPHCQVIRELMRDRFHPYIARGTAYQRIRRSSEGEGSSQTFPTHGSLPDIIPHHRDRSVSLPEVPMHGDHVAEIGRSLRRISDDFYHSYNRSPLMNELQNWWESIRTFLSPTQTADMYSRQEHRHGGGEQH
ncbi:hypothetical protein ScPMuIL_014764 [Solemya velum]